LKTQIGNTIDESIEIAVIYNKPRVYNKPKTNLVVRLP
jgi:hypothetical protein